MKKWLVQSSMVAVSMLLLASGCCGKSKRMAGCPLGKCGMDEGAAKAEVAKAEVAKDAEISTEALKALLQARAPVVVLDARTGKFDDGKRLPGAKSLSPQADKANIEALLPSKDALIVTYCSNLQCPASSMLAKKLHELGYRNVLEYRPGIAGWIEAGNTVESSK